MKNRVFYKDNDIEAARRHFAQGLKELNLRVEDLDLTYIYTTTELDHKVAQALQQQWNEALGVIYHKNGIALFKPHVKNIQFTPLGNPCFERMEITGERK